MNLAGNTCDDDAAGSLHMTNSSAFACFMCKDTKRCIDYHC
jgi:hypothetical protein